ncbi:protein ninH [Klebsiella quasipneumoniae]|uniref:protein ninH n=1 Tax=Klebsiella quasipneumoniae TaxID=1463165 RepID=UPI00352B500F
MTPSIKTIHDILVEVRGNQSEAARKLACSRNTILRYSRDTKAQFHAIVNGVLMVHQGGRGKACAQ